MGSFQITLDACEGCCDEPYLDVGDCESLTGIASLCGFSGYDDGTYDPLFPSDWSGQFRKWKDRAIDGGITAASGSCMAGCSPGTNSGTNFGEDYSGTSRLTCSGFTSHAIRDRTQYDAAGPGICNSFNVGSADIDSIDDGMGSIYTITSGCGGVGTIPGFSEVYTLTTRTVSGCGCQSVGTSNYETLGEATETLSDEHYFYDALSDVAAGGGSVTSGDSCCTSLSSADLTEPESQSSISLNGTAVRVQLTIFGCDTVGLIFTVYVTLEQGGTEFVVEALVPCLIPTQFHIPLPAPGDSPICFVSASLTP